jgi:hypothetical protein
LRVIWWRAVKGTAEQTGDSKFLDTLTVQGSGRKQRVLPIDRKRKENVNNLKNGRQFLR